MVEVTGLEPTTSWSRTKRATKLRYTSLFACLPISGRSTTSWSLVVALACLSRRALRCALLYARQLLLPKISLCSIFGSSDRARYQTALYLDSLYIITEAILFVNRKFYFYGGFLQNLRARHRFKAFHSRSARRAARTHKTTSLGRYNILLTKTASQTDA